VALAKPREERSDGGGGNGGGHPPAIDPIIAGLLKRIRKSAATWSKAQRKLCLQLPEGRFDLGQIRTVPGAGRQGGKIECRAFLPDIEILDPIDAITSCTVHKKKMTRTRRARAETTTPMLTERMTTAWSGVRSEIDRLGMVKTSSAGSPSRAPCTRVAIHERPARDSGQSCRQAAPRRPSLARWGNLGRPCPSRTLRLRFLSP